MNKRRTVRDCTFSSDCSQQVDNAHEQDTLINAQQHIYESCHHHSPTRENRHRNNHNSGLIQHDEVFKSINNATHRKRRPTKSSLIPIYINNALLILIRLMILFITILIISLLFYHAILYIYPLPKRNRWERVWYSIINWIIRE
jgi:hypothetical protein